MQDAPNITTNDTLPFTNHFNYVVKELGIKEFRGVLAQIREDKDRENKTAFLLYKLGCFTNI